MHTIKKQLRTASVYLFIFLYKSIRPLLGPDGACCYFLTCSQYAQKKINTEPYFLYALWLILKRVGSCSIFGQRNRNYFDA